MKKLWQIGAIPFVLFLLATSIAVASNVEPLAQDEASTSLSQTFEAAQVGPSAVNIDGPTAGTVDTDYDFPVTVDPADVTLPISITIDYTDRESPWSVVLSTRVFTIPNRTWSTPGTKTITVTAKNFHGTATDTHTIVIEDAGTKVILTGPDSGVTNTPYAFTATMSPTSATQPINYTFERTDGTGPLSSGPVYTHSMTLLNVKWTTPGSKVVTVTAQNTDETYIDTHTIEIESGSIFLPLVQRNYTPPFSPSETIPWNYTIMRVPEAWALSTGQGIIIADVGTGVDLDHPDLAANIVSGYDFVDDDTIPDDELGVGSFVAGIIAGVANNGGIVGVAPHAKIMPVKVFDGTGDATYADIADGIDWAYDNGADIINFSFILTQQSGTVEDALEDVYYSVMLAMVGDCGGDDYAAHGCTMQNQFVWPARFIENPVGSTNINDQLSDFSSEALPHMVAPGEGVTSAGLDGGYATGSSTGYASAHAAGAAALVWAANPTYGPVEVVGAITHSAVDLGLLSMAQGQGRIDAGAAITQDPYGGWANADASTAQPVPSDARTLDAPQQTTTMIEDEVLVKLSDGASLNRVWNKTRFKLSELRVIDVLEGLNIYRLSVPADQRTTIINSLLQTPGVEFAEPNYSIQLRW
jgi:subtilisin family serine protease